MISRNIPRLRFKKFKDEWNLESLEDNIRYVRGNNGDINDLPILTISAGNGWMNQKDRFGNVLAGKELKNYTLLKKYQLSYNHGNSKLAKFGAVFMLRDYDKALVPKVYHSFEMTKNNSPFFIENLFSSKIPDRQLGKLITSGARMDGLLNINKKAFSSIKLNFPSLLEQQHIGNFFSKLDHLIDLHSQKLEQLKKLKRGYLQRMFPQKSETVPSLRFSGFSDKWKEIRLKNISRCETSKYTQGQFKEEPNNGIYKVFDVSGISGSINEYDQEHNYISIVKDGSGVGTVTLRPAKTSIINTMNYIINDNSNIKYLFYLLETFNFYRYKIGTGIPHIYYSDYSNEKVRVPSIDEQKKIGSFFNNLDKKIKFENDKIEELKKQKKAYLQKMFI